MSAVSLFREIEQRYINTINNHNNNNYDNKSTQWSVKLCENHEAIIVSEGGGGGGGGAFYPKLITTEDRD